MKIKTLFSVCALSLLTGFSTTVMADDANWTKVATADEFVNAVNNNKSANILLTDNIDLSGHFMLSSYDHPFKGKINGNMYILSGCKYESSEDDNVIYYNDAGSNAALFPYAEGATFENLIIENFHITQKDEWAGTVYSQGLLTGTSTNCHFTNITIMNSNILLNEDKDYKSVVGAFVGTSTNNTFESCTVTSNCTLQGYSGIRGFDTNVGGLVGTSTSDKFTLCHSAATIWADDNNDGGIAGKSSNSTFDRCLNSGKIFGYEYVGGIVGRASGTTINKCVNLGTIESERSVEYDYHGGIVGYMSGGTVGSCFNFGEIQATHYVYDPICGEGDDEYQSNGGNYYYCKYKKTEGYTNAEDIIDDLKSGAYAAWYDWLYQNFDSGSSIDGTYPVPIPAAGKVYSNVLCDGTQSYSNVFHSEGAHEPEVNATGYCSVCGRQVESRSTIYVQDATDLVALSYLINLGKKSFQTVIFQNDIDMSSVENFTPIGKDPSHSFSGAVVGNGHRIKNMKINRTSGQEGTGLFGCVNGSTTISDLIIDSSCTITSNGRGVAGLIGIFGGGVGYTHQLKIQRCGNEATINGGLNSAGILGGVYYFYNNSAMLYVNDCYNTGTITATKEAAAIVAWANYRLEMNRCWNTGLVTPVKESRSMIRYEENMGGIYHKFNNNYQLDTLVPDNNATSKPAEDFADGAVCSLLNKANKGVWGQNLGVDNLPTFSKQGVRHERSASSTWGTVVLPFATTSNADVQLYKVVSCNADQEETAGSLTLAPVDTVDANTPCFYKKLDASATSVCFKENSGTFNMTDDDPESIVEPILTDAGWSMVGSYGNLSELKGVYYMAQDRLWYAEEPITLPAYRAYMTHVEEKHPCKSFSLRVLDEDGDVDQIVNIMADNSNGACYNLAGQRLQKPQRGINIIGGKLILKK